MGNDDWNGKFIGKHWTFTINCFLSGKNIEVNAGVSLPSVLEGQVLEQLGCWEMLGANLNLAIPIYGLMAIQVEMSFSSGIFHCHVWWHWRVYVVHACKVSPCLKRLVISKTRTWMIREAISTPVYRMNQTATKTKWVLNPIVQNQHLYND